MITSSKISSAPTRSHSARRPVEESGRRGDDAHVRGDRLDDDGGDLIVELGHHVVGRDDRVGDGRVRNAGRAGQAERGHAAATGDQQRVGRTVEVAART